MGLLPESGGVRAAEVTQEMSVWRFSLLDEMKYQPLRYELRLQKFFIGLMDFFSILLPGALLTWLLMHEVGPVVLGDRYAKLAGAEA